MISLAQYSHHATGHVGFHVAQLVLRGTNQGEIRSLKPGTGKLNGVEMGSRLTSPALVLTGPHCLCR